MGIHHVEFWIGDWERSRFFYHSLFQLLGWEQCGSKAYIRNGVEIYFVEQKELMGGRFIGPRHICLQASSRELVDQVARWLQKEQVEWIRGPVERPDYSAGYYTVDFRDPDGYIWEVAYIPD